MSGPLDVYRNAARESRGGGEGCAGCLALVLIAAGFGLARWMGWL